MRTTRVILGVAVALCIVLAAGQAALAADFPKGTFSLKEGGDTWAIKFMDEGKLTVSRNGQLAVEGTYKVTKEEVEFKDVAGPLADKNDKGGKYKWKLDGKKLTFEKINDASPGRAATLPAGAWTKE